MRLERAMVALRANILLILRSRLQSRAKLQAENLALRRQVLILSRKNRSRVRLRNLDRLVLVWPYRIFPSILSAIIVIAGWPGLPRLKETVHLHLLPQALIHMAGGNTATVYLRRLLRHELKFATDRRGGLVTEQTEDSYAATFDTNVLGVLLSMKHELRVMLPQGSGSIVNVSSAYGSVGAPGAAVYVGSKHAVEGMTKSAALEVAGTGVRVNVVAPGTTDTGMLTRFTSTDENKAALVSMVPVKRLATPEEIAHVIVFVASANASYMTGASIPVDGGMLAD
jgi:NAD(P)-dependent dehydrogenase (short-subunit alcohol dehydrogenase family)